MRDVVIGFFESEQIEPTAKGTDTFAVVFSSEAGPLEGLVRVDETTGVLAIWSVCPVRVPPERMPAALELVARLNFGHVLGNLEIDVDTGIVRFKTSLDASGEDLSEGLVANCVYANLASLEQMTPAVRAVVEGASPAEAVR